MRRFLIGFIAAGLLTTTGCASMKRFAWNIAPASIKKRILKKAARKRAKRIAKQHAPMTQKLIDGQSLTPDEARRVAPCLKYVHLGYRGEPCFDDPTMPIAEVAALLDQVSDETYLGCTAAVEFRAFLRDGGATDEGLTLLADLSEFGMLESTIQDVAKVALKDEPPEKQEEMATQLDALVMAELCSGGYLDKCKGDEFEGWEAFGKRIRNKLAASGHATVHDPRFESELEPLMGRPFTSGNSVELLETGVEGRQVRRELKQGLEKGDRYWFATWGVYPDGESPREWCDDLLKLYHEGVDVRGIVDKGTLERQQGCVLDLQAAGIPIVEYGYKKDSSRSGWSTHVKWEMRYDASTGNKEMVLDSRNIGPFYLHDSAPGEPKWDDFGARVCGPAVTQAEQFFVDTWNDWHDHQGLLIRMQWLKLDVEGGDRGPCPGTDWDATNVRAAAVGQQSRSASAELVASKLKLVRGAGAGDTIYLQNAYVIEVPPLSSELVAAAERGAKIIIHTNSLESIDEEGGEIVMPPILKTLQNMLADAESKGVADRFDIHLQKGINTVHSKLEVVGDYADFGSDNWHPRGWMYERELNLFIHDATIADMIRADVDGDLENTSQAPRSSDIEVPQTPLSRMSQLLWNQL